MSFTHLHVHSEYSMLDGAIKVKQLVEKAAELGQKSVAITDHGWIASAVKFVKAAKDHSIKPIIGMEAYLATGDSMKTPAKSSGDNTHLTLIAKDKNGFRNLSMLTSLAHIDGFSYKPRIDYSTLEQYSEGLIVLSGCIGAQIPRLLVNGKEKEARKLARWYRDTFKGRFFIELMSHGETDGISHVREQTKDGVIIMQEHELNDALVSIGDMLGVGVVATNDAHYLVREHGEHQDTLLCLGTGSWKHKPERMRFPGSEVEAWEFYIKSEQEMLAASSEPYWATACANTVLVSDMVEDSVLEFGLSVMPQAKVPTGDVDFRHFQKTGRIQNCSHLCG